MLRSVIVVLFVGTVASSSACTNFYITWEIPPETCPPPSTPQAEAPEPSRRERQQSPERPTHTEALPMLVFVKVPGFLDRGLHLEGDPFPGPDEDLIPIVGSPLYESIQREFDLHLGPPIMSCIVDERDATPDLKGMLEITFVIAADGSIPGPVELDASWGAASEGLISCIRETVEVYVFSEGSLTIIKPYRLN